MKNLYRLLSLLLVIIAAFAVFIPLNAFAADHGISAFNEPGIKYGEEERQTPDTITAEYAEDSVIVKVKITNSQSVFGLQSSDSDSFYGIKIKDAETLASLPSSAFQRRAGQPVQEEKIMLLTLEDCGKDAVNEAIRILQQNPSIEYAEPNYFVYGDVIPSDPDYGMLYGMEKISAPAAWDITVGSADVLIGVIDSGIDYTHPDLAANMWVNPGELPGNAIDDDGNGYIDDIHGWNFINNTNDIMDDNGHGTHVAGTIGAVSNNNLGVAGVSWNVKIVGLKFLGNETQGESADAIRALDYANKMGIDITNNSWGAWWLESQALKEMISRSGLFIAAAGNDAYDNDEMPHYPSSYDLDNIIAVANTTQTDSLADNSCYGAVSVDLAAPGYQIYSTDLGGGYRIMSGTSMAAPHVTGTAALIRSLDPSISTEEIKEILLGTVDPLSTLEGKMVSGGRLNAYKAVEAVASTPVVIKPSIMNLHIEHAATGTFTATIRDEAMQNLTLEWSSSDSSVAAVDDSGKVTAIGAGRATITAKLEAYPELFGQAQVNVYSSTDYMTGITIQKKPDKLLYKLGEALDLRGLAVAARYYDNTSANVTEYVTEPLNGTLLDTPGSHIVTVTYTEKDSTRTAQFEVVVVDEEYIYFPDRNFELEVLRILGKTPSQSVLPSEAAGITELDVMNKNIADLTGIEHFINLEHLFCAYNKITFLEISGLSKLYQIHGYYNRLERVSVTDCPELEHLHVQDSDIINLTISDCPSLRYIWAGENALSMSGVQITNSPNITALSSPNNSFTSIDLSLFPSLDYLDISGNNLISLDLTPVPNLTSLRCNNNLLTALDLTVLPSLIVLYCDNNELTSLDVSKSPSLRRLTCTNNYLRLESSITGLDKSKYVEYAFSPQRSRTLSSIEVMSLPDKLTYAVNGQLDLTGLAVLAKYSNGTSREITGYTAAPSNGSVLHQTGSISIRVSYTENNRTLSTVFSVSVVESVSLSAPTIVEKLAAYLKITVADERLAGAEANAYLKVGGELLYETPVVNGLASMFIPAAPDAGDYELVVETSDGSIVGSCTIEVTDYNDDIWVLNSSVDADGFVTLVFNETIAAKDGKFDKEVSLNGTVIGCTLSADGKTLLTDKKYDDLPAGTSTFVVVGVKYPRLFPSYSFTFTTQLEQ